MAIARELRIRKKTGGIGVGDLHPFEIEEDQMLVDFGAFLARPAHQGSVCWVVRFGREDEVGVDGGPIHLLGQAFELLHGGEQNGRRRTAAHGDLAAIGRLERLCSRQALGQVAVETRVV